MSDKQQIYGRDPEVNSYSPGIPWTYVELRFTCNGKNDLNTIGLKQMISSSWSNILRNYNQIVKNNPKLKPNGLKH